jgi:ergothioneine biosynthesis protein EgtB
MPPELEAAAVVADIALHQRFCAVREATLEFAAPLTPEDMMVQSCADASPVKWHLAHTSWFFETFVLSAYAPGYQAFHPDFCWLFNSYYTSLGEMPEKKLRASFSRPSLADILAYRMHVDEAVEALLQNLPSADTDDANEVLRRVALGLEHEQQHLELAATDIKHAFFTNPLHPAYASSPRVQNVKQSTETSVRFERFAGGLVQIGVSPDAADPLAFAFDNETPRHKVFLEPYALANRLVTARDYLAFINDNGYTRPEIWLSEGWSTMRAEGWQAPLYWRRSSAAECGWEVFTLRGFVPLETVLDAPVCHISLFEADAFARWSGARLPTEAEWESAAASISSDALASGANMLETGALQPVPAQAGGGLQQMFGDVWEWTSSGYTGYPGYKPLPGALGEYNGKFMSSQVILRGGSCITPASHIRASYRNFFQPSTRWQFTGLRLAQDATDAS